ncbi:MAG: hypothetical protein RBR42_05040 [Desulfomicrobium sp.]|nr:hypothetical protein [Desulfomicrobium sp.]
MTKTYEALTHIKDVLCAARIAKSVAIGLEPEITGKDYPLIRIVPRRSTPRKGGGKIVEVLIYFGDKLSDYKGLELIYQKMAEVEDAVTSTIKAGHGWKAEHLDTVYDGDTLKAYKIAVARFKVVIG